MTSTHKARTRDIRARRATGAPPRLLAFRRYDASPIGFLRRLLGRPVQLEQPAPRDFLETTQAARRLCGAGDHDAELKLWAASRTEAPDPIQRDLLGMASALSHLVDAASDSEREALAERLRDTVVEGIRLANERMDRERTRPATRRDSLDFWVRYLMAAELALGLEPSELSADLTRRESNRALRPKRRSSGGQRPPLAIWRRDAKAYWHDYYVGRHGTEPPEGWWWERPELAMGGQIRPDLWREFGGDDRAVSQAFYDEMRRRDREENPTPERWRAEADLAACVAKALPGHQVIRQARPEWLGTQALDVYVPSLRIALEYQGEQHYFPLPHLGGEAGLENRRRLDAAKRRACRRAGIRLVAWRYNREISLDAVRHELARVVRPEEPAGLQPPRAGPTGRV